MKQYKEPYDDYASLETFFNCLAQGHQDWLIDAYFERAMHEVKIRKVK